MREMKHELELAILWHGSTMYDKTDFNRAHTQFSGSNFILMAFRLSEEKNGRKSAAIR